MSFSGDGHGWNWQDEEFRLDADSPLAISRSLWDELTQSEEDSKNLFEATPGNNAYGDSDCPGSSRDSGGSIDPTQSQSVRGSPLYKRRRMLQFAATDSDSNGNANPAFATFEECREILMEGGMDRQMSDPVSSPSRWLSRAEEANSSASDSFDQSCENWMARCFNGEEAAANSADPTAFGDFDDQIDVSEICAALQSSEMDAGLAWQDRGSPGTQLQQQNPSAGNCGMNRNTPIAYPFALIKPCGVQGDVTLKDINQRISGQSSGKLGGRASDRQALRGQALSTSAFSGKAVVHLTKIHTEGKGSITIMRTKG